MDEIIFETAKEGHLPEILTIYNHYVLNSTATFHMHGLTAEEMRKIVFFMDERYRTFVIKSDGSVCGYVILTRYKTREAFDGTAEVTVYLKPEATGKGIGKRAVRYIEDFARAKGLHTLVALICGENSGSIALFEHSGYEKCAHYKEVGKKFGRWLDLVVYQKIINES